jgi:hypothetical protein
MMSPVAKLILSVALDIVDFTVGRMPGLEAPVDILCGIAAVMMWGWPGLFAFLELADPTGQIDGFVPTLTIIALARLRADRGKGATPPARGKRAA